MIQRQARCSWKVPQFVEVSLCIAALMFIAACSGDVGRDAPITSGSEATRQESSSAGSSQDGGGWVVEEELVSAPTFGMAVTGRMEVVTVYEGSSAHRAGIREGDILQKLNGAAIEPGKTGVAAFRHAASKQMSDRQQTVMVLSRGGKSMLKQLQLESAQAGPKTVDDTKMIRPGQTPAVLPGAKATPTPATDIYYL